MINEWGFGAALAAILVSLLTLIFNQVRATKWAEHHQGVMRVWGLADDIATRIVSSLGANPSAATRASVIAAGVAELKITGAQALGQIVGGTSDATLSTLLSTKVDAQTAARPAKT